ncbi:phage tail repeat-like family [Trichomonas vaginalis G3]|uniref:phage tail repeat-like family n=1 Tax=Trichomonas vaginalis (strain ATCC PRA-98 / G3) TaxID=412133 RepID=UPI0021E55187|nr:phage tail repeat-like family [Trichomonas vaginalis G3]KAI5520403.1 phage tail repeat-like family [Trichomonas vaginalis G3]
MSKDIASMREIQHNRQLIMQALNKNTTNFSNYSKISESLKEGNLKLTLNPMTDEFLFQDKKNNTVCINPTKGTLNEKPINELLLKADVDNKADKEYVDDAIAKEEERANNAYATKEHTHPELADKTYVDNKMSSEVTRAENEYSKKTHTHSISEITDLNVSLENKVDKGLMASVLVKKADKEYVDEKDKEIIERAEWYHERTSKILKTKADTGWVSGCLDLKADKTYVNDELEKKADKTHTHTSFTTFTADDITLNTTLPSKGPTIPPATSLVDTLISNDNSIMHLRQELNVLKQILPNLMYPVGSLYVSMNSTRPETVLGFGTWTQIVDRFLYCANSSKETGGSKTISGENLPAHSHYIDLSTSQAGWHKHRYWDWSAMTKGKGYDVKDNVQFAINCYWSNTEGGGNHTHRVSGYTQTTGQSKEYMPPYMTVYAWYRNA